MRTVQMVGGIRHGQVRQVSDSIISFIYDKHRNGQWLRWYYRREGDRMVFKWSGPVDKFDQWFGGLS